MTGTVESVADMDAMLYAYTQALGSAGSVTGEQAKIILRLGHQQLRVSNLELHGIYVGTNVSYNLGRLVELGLIEKMSIPSDRRVCEVKLTAAGLLRRDRILAAHEAFVADPARHRHFLSLFEKAEA
jgi:DNA-binding MarR family transcriptional regulator